MMIYKPATRRAGRILLTSLLVVNLLLGYLGQATLTAQAQIIKDPIDTTSTGVQNAPPTYVGRGVEDSLREYLCVPDESNLGTALFTCITKLYKFGIAFGAIALVFFVVFAGYMYMVGGETGKGKAKGILLSAITGMAIMLSSYVLLNFINPDLVKIKPIQPPIFTSTSLPSCESVGYGKDCVLPSGQVQIISNDGGGAGPKGKACSLMVGNCSPQTIAQAGCTPEQAKAMSILCSVESSNDPTIYSRSDICTDSQGKQRSITLTNNPSLPANVRGKTIPMSASWGLFQFNLTFHNVGGIDCKNAFNGTFTGSSKDCNVKDQPKYESCIAAATTVQSHLQYACKLVREESYSPWTCSAWKCGIQQNGANCASAFNIKQIVPYRNPLLGQ